MSILVAAATLSACGGRPTTFEGVAAVPEASLLPPGAEVLATGGGDDERTLTGPTHAFAWKLVGVQQTSAEVEAFYTEELAARGWAVGGRRGSHLRSTSEDAAFGWHKGDLVFRLGIQDMDGPDADPEAWAPYTTVIDVRVIAIPAEEA